MTRLVRRLGLLLAAAPLLLTGCGFKGLYGAPLPGGADLGSHPYKVTIYFQNVADLVPQSSVKVNNVVVGKVTDIQLAGTENTSDRWMARVTAELNGDVDLPDNATAAVEMTSLLGEHYVELRPPAENPDPTRLTDGSVISLDHTTTAPDAEDVFGALSLLVNGGGFQQIRTITTELNAALGGNESVIRDLVKQLTTFSTTLDRQKKKITDSLDAIDKLSKTLRSQEGAITTTLQTMPAALQVLNRERGELVRALSSLARLGHVAGRVVNESGDNLVATLRSLQPTVTQLANAGLALPHSLRVGLTYPYPTGTVLQAIKGDYINLHLYLDLTITDELCGVLASKLCLPLIGAK
jgi:phospholipid/cholesterol/gamma-HCH transport system substrate-binding protein